MGILTSKLLWGAVGALFYTILVFHWGDAYGPNAQANAASAAELAATNQVLTDQLEQDATTYAAENADRQKGMATFKQALPNLNACQLAPADVDALLKLIGD